MASGLPRDILKWLLSLNLSFPIKNVKRDFSNGCLVAEIVSRYFPDDIHMHSFENVTSMQRKKAQWGLIEKAFKKHKAPITRKQMDAVMNAEQDAAEDLLQALRKWLLAAVAEGGSPTRRGAGGSAATSSQEQQGAGQAGYDPYSQGYYPQQAGGYGGGHPDYGQPPQQQGGYGYPPQAFVFGSGSQEPQPGAAPSSYDQQQQGSAAGDVSQQQQMSVAETQAYYAAYYQAMDNAQNYAHQCAAAGGDPYAAYYEAMAQQGFPMAPQQNPDGSWPQQGQQQGPGQDGGQQRGKQPGAAKGAGPRLGEKTDYKPYTMQDYKQKQYDPKTAKGGYWELGRIGPDLETDELREKREKAERMKEYARNAHQKNMSSPAKATKPKAPATKEPTARERALEFAKNVPKPEVKKPKEEKRPGGRSGDEDSRPLSELERMEMQHRLDQQRIEAIKQEMGNLGV